MEKQKVFIPVEESNSDEFNKAKFSDINRIVFAIDRANEKSIKYASDLSSSDKAVLVEQEGYFLTKEKVKHLIINFLKFHYKENPFRKDITNERDAENYIESLNIK